MADEDEIDVIGDFTFDNCLSFNNNQIPLHGDFVHPQWLLDTGETTSSWYDNPPETGSSKIDIGDTSAEYDQNSLLFDFGSEDVAEVVVDNCEPPSPDAVTLNMFDEGSHVVTRENHNILLSKRARIATDSTKSHNCVDKVMILNNDSGPESDVEVDVNNSVPINTTPNAVTSLETPNPNHYSLALEPFMKRKRKVRFFGKGGLTIMHTEAGEIYKQFSEPQKPRKPRQEKITLNHCKRFSASSPAPFMVSITVSTLIEMDVHAHTSAAEVMGLLGGRVELSDTGEVLSVEICSYESAAASASSTHCDMCPVSEAEAAERITSRGLRLVGWHHSHPYFPPHPSNQDIFTQLVLQNSLPQPFVAVITSQQWEGGRRASRYLCHVVQHDEDNHINGIQFATSVTMDITTANLEIYLTQMAAKLMRMKMQNEEDFLNFERYKCKETGRRHLDKCISSIRYHLRSTGYETSSKLYRRIISGISKVLRAFETYAD